VYGFNPCVPIDLMFIPTDERTYMDGVKNTEMMKKKAMNRFDIISRKRQQKYAKHANKGQKMVKSELRDLI